MDAIKEILTNFITSSFVTKLLLFISAFFAPIWELYILLMFLVCMDYIMDLGLWFFRQRAVTKAWEVTQPFVLKVIMYSILVITVSAVQQYLIKEAFDFFKLLVSIPIIAELMGILGTVERLTGIAVVDKAKQVLTGWLQNKANKD